MRNAPPFRVRFAGIAALFLCLAFISHIARAGETADAKTPPTEEEPDYKNWIELSIGGVIVHGDRAQFEQEHRMPGDQVYGGIADMHFETGGKDVQLTVDARGHLRPSLRYNDKPDQDRPRLHSRRVQLVPELV